MRILLFCMIIALGTANVFAAETETVIGRFSSGDLSGWKEQTIVGAGRSTYSFIQDQGRKVLQGKSSDSASGLLLKIDLDPKTTPVIKWSWKIDQTVKKGNDRIKDGHDFAARLYVIFPRGIFASHRAIEYIWGNILPKGEFLRSPYSKNAVMIAVDSGNELAGKWTFHRRNFYEDYRTAFGEEPPNVGAFAIMTDSDNTHESAVGYYGDISIITTASKIDESKQKESKQRESAPKDLPPKESRHKEPPTGGFVGPPVPATLPNNETKKP